MEHTPSSVSGFAFLALWIPDLSLQADARTRDGIKSYTPPEGIYLGITDNQALNFSTQCYDEQEEEEE